MDELRQPPSSGAGGGPAGSITARTVSIGDSICLTTCDNDNAYLYSMQSFEPKVFVRDQKKTPIENFHAAVFEIYVQFEYRHQKQHKRIARGIKQLVQRSEKLQEKLKNAVEGSKDGADRKVQAGDSQLTLEAGQMKMRQDNKENVERLIGEIGEIAKKKADLEHNKKQAFKAMQQDHEQNALEQERQMGKPLVYGDIVQFRHRFTDDFLAASTAKTSVLEYNTLQVFLQEHSDRSCFFRVLPRFKVRGEGDEVKHGDQIILMSVKASGHYLTHSAGRFTSDNGIDGIMNDSDFEASLSAQERAWNIHIYTQCRDRPDDRLHAGDVIQIHDREKNGWLSAAKMIAVERGKDGAVGRIQMGDSPQAVDTAYLNTSIDVDGGLRQESMSYWQIYIYSAHEIGSPLTYDVQKVVLRHLVTGMYLAVDSKADFDAASRNPGSSPGHAKAILIRNPDDARAVFRISSVNAHGQYICNDTYCRLQNIVTGAYFHTSKSALGALDSHTYDQCKAKKGEIDDDLFDEKYNVNFRTQLSFEDAFEITKVSEENLDDFNIVFGLIPLLKLVVEATSAECSGTLPSQLALFPDRSKSSHRAAWQRLGSSIIAEGAKLFEFLAEFLVDEEDDDTSDEWGKAAYARQGLCQDLGVLDLTLDILQGPIRDLDYKILTKEMFKELGSNNEKANLLWNKAFESLKNAAAGEETATDRYIARYSKIFLLHSMYLKTHGSAELLIELYTDNRDAQDDLLEDEKRLKWILDHVKVADSTGQDFIDHDFFDFLSSICVCKELAVVRAQTRIFEALIMEGDALFELGHFVRFTVQEKPTVSPQKSRKNTSTQVAPHSRILVTLGKSKSNVPISNFVCTRSNDKQSEGQQLPRVEYAIAKGNTSASLGLDYLLLVSNIRLLASLCKGHNREQVALVNKAMPGDVPFVIVQDKAIPFDLRGVAAHVLHELYLDTGGARTVLSLRDRRQVFTFDLDAESSMNDVLDLDKYRSLNVERKKIGGKLHSWLCKREDGFKRDLLDFVFEMQRLIGDESEFEQHHRQHGSFVIQILRSAYFLVECGFYQDWRMLEELLSLLSQHLLVHAEDIITTENSTCRNDETRDAVIAEVIEWCLKIFQLAYVYEACMSTKAFFKDWVKLMTGKDVPGLSASDVVKNVLFDTRPNSEPNFNKLYDPHDRAPVMNYLSGHFKNTSLFKKDKKSLSLREIVLNIVKKGQPEKSEEYESNIVHEGMALIDLMYSREVGLFRGAANIRVVNHADSRDLVRLIDDVLPQLQYLVEDTQINRKEASEVSRLVTKLIHSMAPHGESNSEFQDIVYKAGGLEIVLKIFDQTLDDDDLQDDIPHELSPNDLQKALISCLDFIKMQTRGHELAQDRLFDEIVNLLRSKNTRPRAVVAALATALAEIFHNSEYQMRIRTAHIEEICRVMFTKLEDKIYVAELLDLLASTVKCEGRGYSVTRNQGLIVSALMQQEENVLGTLKASASGDNSGEVQALLDAAEDDPLYRYHISLVKLLAVLGEGENQFIESICKKVYSCEQLLQILTSSPYVNRISTFCAYLQFLFYIYISEMCRIEIQHPRPIYADSRTWDIIDHIGLHLTDFQREGLNESKAEYLFGAAIPFLTTFFKVHYKPGDLDQDLDLLNDTENMSQISITDTSVSRISVAIGALEVKSRCESAVVSIAQSLSEMIFTSYTCNSAAYWTKVNRRNAVDLVVVLLRSTNIDQCAAANIMSFIKGHRIERKHDNALAKGKMTLMEPARTSSTVDDTIFIDANVNMEISESSTAQSNAVTQVPDLHNGISPLVQNPIYSGNQSSMIPPTTLASMERTHRGQQSHRNAVDSDDLLTRKFQRYVKTFWVIYGDQNRNEGHECQKEDRNKDCFYLEVRDDGETILPCGAEFQRKIDLFEDDDDEGFQVLLRYLGFLQSILMDVGASDDEKERARNSCVTTLNLLSAIMHRYKCQLFEGSNYKDHTSENYKNLKKNIFGLQTKLALAGGVLHCINLMADDEDDVMKAALLLFMMLLDGGNPSVQDIVFDVFQAQDTSISLIRIRDELARGVAALQQLQRTDVRRQFANDPSQIGTLTYGANSMTGTLQPEDVQVIKDHFAALVDTHSTCVSSDPVPENTGERQKEELQWVLDIVETVQLLAEGAHRKNQDWLREQKGTKGQSVNFVAELCRALSLVYMNAVGRGEINERRQWLHVTEKLLDSITEVCQGNQENQQEALDEQIIKMINHIIAYDVNEEHFLSQLTDTKRSALTVLESMLESNNSTAAGIAKTMLTQLNLEELYLAMNRFYYIDFYLRHRPYQQESGHTPHSERHLKAGYEIFAILSRIRDLTGVHYQWEQNKKAQIAKLLNPKSQRHSSGLLSGGVAGLAKGAVGLGLSGLAGLSKNVIHFAGLPQNDGQESKSEEEKRLEEFIEGDNEVKERFFCNVSEHKEESQERITLYCKFCRNILSELDKHGGDNIGLDPDRFEYFKINTHSIEFLRDNQLQKVYFKAPEVVISKTVRKEILLKLNHTAPQDKLRDFVNEFSKIRKELRYQMRLRSHVLTSLIAEGTGPYWKAAVLFITYTINTVLLAAYTAPHNPDTPDAEYPEWFPATIWVLGSIHVLLSLIICGEYLVNNFTLPPTSNVTYHILFVFCSFLGLFYRAYFFAFHTLHIVQDNDILYRAIESITRNGISLLSVTFLAITVVYLFAVVAFLIFRADFDEEDGQFCNSLLECVVTVLAYGFTHGGGPREVFGSGNRYGYFDDPHYLGRVAFDLAFWILIAVIIMNLVLGIIVDTFSQLRSEREQNMDIILNSCFMCTLPAHAFDDGSGGFKNHVHREHNMWDYVYYSMYLLEIPESERNYHEVYLYKHFVQEPSITPFPLKRALGVKTVHNDAKSQMQELTRRIDRLEQMLTARFEQADQAAVLSEQLDLQEQWRQRAENAH